MKTDCTNKERKKRNNKNNTKMEHASAEKKTPTFDQRPRQNEEKAD